jgi:hypothetical protein
MIKKREASKCEYCKEDKKKCQCYSDFMLSEKLNEESEIYEYTHR